MTHRRRWADSGDSPTFRCPPSTPWIFEMTTDICGGKPSKKSSSAKTCHKASPTSPTVTTSYNHLRRLDSWTIPSRLHTQFHQPPWKLFLMFVSHNISYPYGSDKNNGETTTEIPNSATSKETCRALIFVKGRQFWWHENIIWKWELSIPRNLGFYPKNRSTSWRGGPESDWLCLLFAL